jgi:hypothetical protein
LKIGSPKLSARSFWLVRRYTSPALAASVPGAVPVPPPFDLFSAVATIIKGTVPGSAGV